MKNNKITKLILMLGVASSVIVIFDNDAFALSANDLHKNYEAEERLQIALNKGAEISDLNVADDNDVDNLDLDNAKDKNYSKKDQVLNKKNLKEATNKKTAKEVSNKKNLEKKDTTKKNVTKKIIGQKNESLFAACAKNDIKKVKTLLKNGLKVNAKDQSGNTPLMISAAQGNLEIAKILVKKGADVNAINYNGESVIYIANANNKQEMVNYLKNQGADDAFKTVRLVPEYQQAFLPVIAGAAGAAAGTSTAAVAAKGAGVAAAGAGVVAFSNGGGGGSSANQNPNANQNIPVQVEPLTDAQKNATGKDSKGVKVKVAIIDNGVVTNNSDYLTENTDTVSTNRVKAPSGVIGAYKNGNNAQYYNDRNSNGQQDAGEEVNIAEIKDFTDTRNAQDNEAAGLDEYYHATRVAAIISSIAPDASLSSLRAIVSSSPNVYINNLYYNQALEYAIKSNMQVINNSFGTSGDIYGLVAEVDSKKVNYFEFNKFQGYIYAGLVPETIEIFDKINYNDKSKVPLFVWAAGNDGLNSPSLESGWYLLLGNGEKLKYNWLSAVALKDVSANNVTKYQLNGTSNACGVSVQARCIGAVADDTSRAAAQVSGAAAKLISAGLTPDRAAERILATANYIQADGTVIDYKAKSCNLKNGYIECQTNSKTGVGVLNEELAFSPLGTTLVVRPSNNANIALFSGSSLKLSPIFGDALQNSGIKFTVADNNGDEESSLGSLKFKVNLDNYVTKSPASFNANDALADFGEKLFQQYLQLSPNLSLNSSNISDKLYGSNKLENDNIMRRNYSPEKSSKIDREDGAKLSLNYSNSSSSYAANYNVATEQAFGYSAIDKIQNYQLLGKDNNINPYLAFADVADSFAASYNLGENSKVKFGFFDGANKLTYNESSGYLMEVTSKYKDKMALSLQLGNITEKDSLLGMKGNVALDFTNQTPTNFVGIGTQYNLTSDISVFGSYNYGVTKANIGSSSMVSDLSNIVSDSFSFGAVKSDIFTKNDNFNIGISQPLRVRSGTISFFD